mmetsp:Transcript_101981/g.287883  ORF Transcript_101981/g.287883 Transcript_101981/m.287883 type:complete len:610 (+) Transcript_101981:59-1888(+)
MGISREDLHEEFRILAAELSKAIASSLQGCAVGDSRHQIVDIVDASFRGLRSRNEGNANTDLFFAPIPNSLAGDRLYAYTDDSEDSDLSLQDGKGTSQRATKLDRIWPDDELRMSARASMIPSRPKAIQSPELPREPPGVVQIEEDGEIWFVPEVRKSRMPGKTKLGWGEPVKKSKAKRKHKRFTLRTFVLGTTFDYVFGFAMLLNAASMGYQTDYEARRVTDETAAGFQILESVFCGIFTLELLLRLWAMRCDFFKRRNLFWGVFDIAIVTSQLSEEVLRVYAKWSGETESGSQAAGWLNNVRLFRVLRLIRVMRLVRMLKLIGELRTMLSSIMGSLRSLVWAVMLLVLMMFIVGVCITRLVLDQRVFATQKGVEDFNEELVRHFGSLGDSIYALYKCVTGGIDWGDVADPLASYVSIWILPFMMFYIAFALLCMLNVITGVFVETALLNARKDQTNTLVNHVHALYTNLQDEGAITENLDWTSFIDNLDTEKMQIILEEFDIDASEMRAFYKLLDTNDDGSISREEFAEGCKRLRGPAKAYETRHLMRVTARLVEESVEQSRLLQSIFRTLESNGNARSLKRQDNRSLWSAHPLKDSLETVSLFDEV